MQSHFLTSVKGVALQLRPMSAADLDAVLGIEGEVHSHPWSRDNFAGSLRVEHYCWVAEAQRRLVGYGIASAAGGEAELLNISVAAGFQGRGIGHVLLDFIVAQVQPQAEIVFLEVRPSNNAAIALYHAHGFNQVGVRPGYYPADKGREDALILARVLESG